jgi:hypothetical protein
VPIANRRNCAVDNRAQDTILPHSQNDTPL